MPPSRIGIWLIGAKGGVATTATVGLAALQQGLIANTGLVTALPQFAALDLVDWNRLVVGGHDIRDVRLVDEARRMHVESRAIDSGLIERVAPALEEIEANIRPGTIYNVGPTIAQFASGEVRGQRETPRQAIERIGRDLTDFAKSHELAHVIVMNVASTEPPLDQAGLPRRWAELDGQLDRAEGCPLAASSLYAIAALELGCSYVNFTPSLGSAPEAIGELAIERGTRHMGHDGKTGETLLKSTLAPMFAHRNLNVMSWVGHNIFGNLDGKVLDDPANKAAKMTSKDHLLGRIFGYHPQTLVSIEYIESMGDWKTAWDHVHFQGFLGTPMVMQFIWQGCDSLLAAPLVLDLCRFTELSWRRGETGLMTHLASFFKSPLGVDEHDFARQFQMLESWAAR